MQVFSSDEAINASSCSKGTINALFDGAKLRLARVRAASFEIFSSLAVSEPVATSPISRSMHRYYDAILTFNAEVVSLSEIVQRISRQPSRVSTLELIRRLTKFCMSASLRVSRYRSLPADRLSRRMHSTHWSTTSIPSPRTSPI